MFTPCIRRLASFSVAVSATALLSLPSTALANHVDFLIDAPFTSISQFGDTDEVTGDPDNILGAVRNYTTANFGDFAGSVSASLTTGGPLVLADSADAIGQYTFAYGNYRPTGGDLNANFITAANYDSIRFSITSVVGSGQLTASIRSGADSFDFAPLTLSAPGQYSFLYSEITAITPGFDLTSVDGFTFQVSSQTANSAFSVDSVTREAIPEPGSVLLLLGGIFGLALRRRPLARGV